jgi:two-component system response regulator ResD
MSDPLMLPVPRSNPRIFSRRMNVHTAAAIARRRSKLILCVDDDPNIRTIVHQSLADAGYSVIASRDGATALTMLSRYQPRVILLDIEMPEMDGFCTLEEIKQRFPGLKAKVMFLTGRRTLADVKEAKRLGGDDYLIKPFTTGALVQRLDHWVGV